MYISDANNVVIEITRRCNMCCAHCLRGDAENVDIQEKYINAFLDSFSGRRYIGTIVFTGGEISLNIPAIRYTLKAVKERNISVGSFYMVTNGKAVDKMEDLALASLEWWNYCDEKDEYLCGLCISSDNFHEEISDESASILSGLKYNRDDMVTDFHEKYLLNEGRAKTLNDDWSLKREPRTPELVVDYTGNDKIGININEGELYLNTVGDVVVGCDWSYESQRNERPFWDADATNFVVAVRQAMQDKKGSAIWFHQSGSDSEIHGRYYGYQYFEVWDACAEKEAKRMATMIAEKIQTVVSTT